MHRDARTYYEDPSAGGQYSTGQYSSPGSTYPMQGAYNHATYDYQENARYYPPHAHPNDGLSIPGLLLWPLLIRI